MITFFIFFISFLAGSIPTAYLAGKFFGNIDIRQHGSGNVGATNAFRVMGKKIGFAVFFVDFLKGYLPALFLSNYLPLSLSHEVAVLLIGLACILGHVFSPFLNFHGGKGIAAGGGAVCAASPLLFLLTISVWSIIFFLSRLVSLSSLLCLVALIIFSFLFAGDRGATALFCLYFLLALWTHRENLIRLLQGKEKRIS